MDTSVLVIAPDRLMQHDLMKRLSEHHRKIVAAENARSGLEALQGFAFNLAVVCPSQKDMHPILFAIETKDIHPNTPILLLASQFGPNPRLPFIDATIQPPLEIASLELVIDALLSKAA